ncbi:DCP2-domain-containing protein [Trichodelitschia bisporula]|uniref:DCP2-domain-containing protein n=1 Tax=Trichodelitschia bisporula TaxID=703511 RepID=A0A6G1HRE8_9PEZI|nr:DCP2-domain-containing protein [Trichodelitschia bisporula]
MADKRPPMDRRLTMNKSLIEWLDDLCVRFVINLPREELESVERICFQIEEAQWFYEDFVRPLDPTLPSLNLRQFCSLIFQHCVLLSPLASMSSEAYTEFLTYKTRVPVRGAIMLNQDMSKVVLVKGWKKGAKWSFPRGKINKDEPDLDCAIREVYEETGYDLRGSGLVPDDPQALDVTLREQHMRLYVFRGVPMDTYFEPRTRKEISKIEWYSLADLPAFKRGDERSSSFYMVAPFISKLKTWINEQRRNDRRREVLIDSEEDGEEVPEPESEPAPEPEPAAFQRLLSGLRSSAGGVEGAEAGIEVMPAMYRELAAESKRQFEDDNPFLAGSVQGVRGVPHTPFDQITTTPPEADTPHHVPPPAHVPHVPPPVFPYSPATTVDHPHGPRPYPGPTSHPFSARGTQGAVQGVTPTPHAPQGQEVPFAQQFGSHATIPPASRLPAPQLTGHALHLLNVFNGPQTPPKPPAPRQVTPSTGPSPGVSEISTSMIPVSPQLRNIPPPAPMPPAPMPPAPMAPRTHTPHQTALLNLLNADGELEATDQPVELATQPSPRMPRDASASPLRPRLSMRRLSTMDDEKRDPGLVSATVSGPLNAPEFETVRRKPRGSNQSSPKAKSSPRFATRSPYQPQSASPYQPSSPSRLRERATSPAVPLHTARGAAAQIEAPKPFHPTKILRRPEQLTAVVNAQERRAAELPEQKATLLGMLNSRENMPLRVRSPVSPLPGGGRGTGMRNVSGPVEGRESAASAASSAARRGSGPQTPITPVERHFLMGYLEGVAKSATGRVG